MDDLNAHMPQLLKQIVTTEFDISYCVDKKSRLENVRRSSVCYNKLPFDEMQSENRIHVSEKLIQHLSVPNVFNVVENGIELPRNHLFCIYGGSGFGKSHFLDYICNGVNGVKNNKFYLPKEFDSIKEKYFFISLGFNDNFSLNSTDRSQLLSGKLGSTNDISLGVVVRRLLFRYLVETRENKDENQRKLSSIHDKFSSFSSLLSGLQRFELNHEQIFRSVINEIEMTSGKKVVLVLDDISGCMVDEADGIPETRALISVAHTLCRIVFTCPSHNIEAVQKVSKHRVSTERLDGLNMSALLNTQLLKQGIKLSKHGEYLLHLLGFHSRSFACFYWCMMKDNNFHKHATEEKSLPKLIELFTSHWKHGSYSSTNGLTSIFQRYKRELLALICMNLFSIKWEKLALTNHKPGHQTLQRASEYFKEEGLMAANEGFIHISSIMLYYWCVAESGNLNANQGTLDVPGRAINNIANAMKQCFETVFNSEWNGLSNEKLIGEAIHLRYNCGKYLYEYGCGLRKLLEKEYFTLQNVFLFGNHSDKVEEIPSNQLEKRNIKRWETPKDCNYPPSEAQIVNKMKQKLISEHKDDQERKENTKPKLSSEHKDQQFTKKVKNKQINFDKIEWDHIVEIIDVYRFGDVATKDKKWDAEQISKHNDAVDELLGKNKLRGCLFSFADGNPSFDFILKVLLKNGEILYLFIEVKSRAHTERKITMNAMAKNEIQKSLVTQKSIADVVEAQFGSFARTMAHTKYFESKKAGNVRFALFADFPLTDSMCEGIEGFEDVISNYCGPNLGNFLKSVVIGRDFYLTKGKNKKQDGKVKENETKNDDKSLDDIVEDPHCMDFAAALKSYRVSPNKESRKKMKNALEKLGQIDQELAQKIKFHFEYRKLLPNGEFLSRADV